jgi:hypothetical protein
LRALRPRVEHGADVGTTHLSAAARASMDDCLAAMAVVMAASESASFRELCSIAVFCVARVRSAFCVPEPHTPPPRVSDAAQCAVVVGEWAMGECPWSVAALWEASTTHQRAAPIRI